MSQALPVSTQMDNYFAHVDYPHSGPRVSC